MRWVLDDGHELRFCDPRRFGTGELALGTPARDAFFAARLGLEPLDGELTGEALRRMARGRRAPVKAFLLDQRRIAGVGNIYADEALFRARIHPLRPAGSLTRAQCDALAVAVREALAAGVGGGRRDDRRLPPRRRRPRAPSRTSSSCTAAAGEPCPRCAAPVRQVRRRGARDVRVRELPAASAAAAR